MEGTILCGVGGAGCSLAQKIGHSLGVETISIHSDEESLYQMKSNHRLFLECERSGARASNGELTDIAVDSVSGDLRQFMTDNRTVILAVGLGGNTGSGVAPVLARSAMAEGVNLVALVTLPFSFEDERRPVAEAALEKLREEGVELIIHHHAVESQRDDAKNQTFNDYLDSVACSFRSRVEPLLH